MYDPELIERLDKSHSELIKVCRVLMQKILEDPCDIELDGPLMVAEVIPGFAERAEDVEREMSFSRIRAI